MKKSFTLLEILIVIVVLSIIGVIGGFGFLKIYQYYSHTQNLSKLEIQAHTTLLQIKQILQNAIQPSLIINLQHPITQTPQDLKNQSLIFYPKPKESIISDYTLPCLHGFFDPKSLKINSTLQLRFLEINQKSTALLNQKCKNYQKWQYALFIPDSFIAPQDFYNHKYKAKILSLNSSNLQSEIPAFLQNQKQNIHLLPKLYFLSTPSILHFKEHISFYDGTHTHTLTKDFQSFKISNNGFGLVLELCIKQENKNLCIENFIPKEEL